MSTDFSLVGIAYTHASMKRGSHVAITNVIGPDQIPHVVDEFALGQSSIMKVLTDLPFDNALVHEGDLSMEPIDGFERWFICSTEPLCQFMEQNYEDLCSWGACHLQEAIEAMRKNPGYHWWFHASS